MPPTSRTVTDDGQWRGQERRSLSPTEERVTRIEEQLLSLQREIAGQAKRDTQIHHDILQLLDKMDERMDWEHDERIKLGQDLRLLVATVASDVRAIATRLTIFGTLLVVAANILGPLAVKLWTP